MDLKGFDDSNLGRLSEELHLSASSLAAVVALLDPFHDASHTIEGFPDASSAHTYVQKQRFEVTIQAVAAWDCMVVLLPDIAWLQNCRFARVELSGLNFDSADADTDMGQLVVFTNAAGTGMIPTDYTASVMNTYSTVYSTYPHNSASGELSGLARCIGAGVEIYDTSAKVNQQGSVITWRAPGGVHLVGGRSYNDTGPKECYDLIWGSSPPPLDVTDAMQLPGSRSWETPRGAYVTQTLVDPFDNELAPPRWGKRWFGRSITVDSAGTHVNTPGFGNLVDNPLLCRPIPFDTCGAYIQGMHADGTLRIVLHRYLEIAPDINDSNIFMATPSAEYDPVALQLMTRLTSTLPTGTQVSNNASGDWFRFIAAGLRQIAPVLTIIPKYGHLLSSLAQGGSLGAKSVAKALSKPKSREKQRNKQGVTKRKGKKGKAIRV